MKHNLKNRPKLPLKPDYGECAEECIKMDDWFEAFEKELRDRFISKEKVEALLKEADEKKDWKRFAEILLGASFGNRISIAEVLGEESTQ